MSVRRNRSPLVERPLKTSQPTGATLASLGIKQSIPLMHGSQGCSAFAKVYLIQHFREPVPLQNTAVDQIAAVMGADDNLSSALALLCEKHAPELIAVITTGLTEMQGSDINRVAAEFRQQHPEYAHIRLVTVPTPDFVGTMQSGFAAMVDALVKQLVKQPLTPQRRHQVNVLCSSALTPADVALIHRYLDAFGLSAVVLPDLSESMDGHLIDKDYSSTSQGGTSVLEIEEMACSCATIVLGESLLPTGRWLEELFSIPCFSLPNWQGLQATDQLLMWLSDISGKAIPDWLERGRRRLQDAMLDTHFVVSHARVAMAAESDLALGYIGLLDELGAELVRLVTTSDSPGVRALDCDVVVGDLSDLAEVTDEVTLVIGNTHTANLCEPATPVLRAGYPCHDTYGAQDRLQFGYEGARARLFEMANLIVHSEAHEVDAHVSAYRFSPEQLSGGVQ